MFKEKLQTVPLNNVKIEDSFWSRYIGQIKDVVIPYQWEIMNDRVEGAEKSGCIRNFKIAAGEAEGEFTGMPFQDSDLAKWFEAAAFCLASYPNPELEKIIDDAVELVGRAQQEDGYYDTYFMLKEPDKKWMNLKEGHELYVAGHFIEAAVAYYRVTGKKRLLEIVCKNADLICSVFGSGEGQLKAYPGHQEIELALIKLYQVTDNKKYLDTAKFFIDERGKVPSLLEELHKQYGKYIFWDNEMFESDYAQAHLPVREQESAEGHAVRAVYMYTAMADLAYYYRDATLLKACEGLYRNIVEKRMYITGGIGSARFGERFTCDYDLPNDTNYSESCASIGLSMFCQRMLSITGEAKYADTIETALYNTVLAGIGLDGQKFFYVNPLEVWPEGCEKNPAREHVKTERQSWFACACCPPNIARTLASLQDYIYQISDETIYVSLFVSGHSKFKLKDAEAEIRVTTGYPFSSDINIEVLKTGKFRIALRKPGWCTKASIVINGNRTPENYQEERGYLILDRDWKGGEKIVLTLNMPAHFICANPEVRADAGKTAVVKGPLVYCLESVDNGENLSALSVDPHTEIKEVFNENLFGGTTVLSFEGKRRKQQGWEGALYRPWSESEENVTITAVPYSYWNNRGRGAMQVWTRVRTVE